METHYPDYNGSSRRNHIPYPVGSGPFAGAGLSGVFEGAGVGSSAVILRPSSVVCTECLIGRAGFPATVEFGATSWVTTLPAPTMEFSPMVSPPRMVEPDPIDAPFFTRVDSQFQSPFVRTRPLPSVARGQRSLMNITPWPMKTSSSIVTPSQMKAWLEILQRAPIFAPRWTSNRSGFHLQSHSHTG